MPWLDRGIQYSAAAVRSRNFRRGPLDRPIKSGDDTDQAASEEPNTHEKHPVRSHRQGRRGHRLQPRHRSLLG
ncbi:hypothetical protein XH86_06475 [Bradyrhizobium guangdongense]|uniref:Uncharacterized protein n=1 Tax=Bradyrhizobium guangdongense TaxID=1325090 RepID=A0ABX6UBQ0_9BRAD|nr:hypothetical protein X265_06475 [Bradyrhizobium guangdongense]QOZ58416.1 hypothetical protein XH86_06475 [Bradyrhizobium guangdongense]